MRNRIGNTIETPIREVPSFLGAEGCISSERYNDFIVQRITPESVDQLHPPKISLENLAYRMAPLLFCEDP